MKDWKVKSVEWCDAARCWRVTGENLNHPEGDIDRPILWLYDDLRRVFFNPRFDLSQARLDIHAEKTRRHLRTTTGSAHA